MKIAFVAQPIDTIIPPNQNSVGSYTYGVARPLARSCEVVVYGIADKHEPLESNRFPAQLDFRFFPAAASDKLLFRARHELAKFVQPPVPVSISRWLYPAYGEQVAIDLQKQQCDVIHVQHCSQYVPVIRKYNPRAKIVLLIHAEWFSQMKRSILLPRLRDVDLMLTVSDHVTAKTKRDYPELAGRCETMYYGIEARDFDREKDYQAANRRTEKRILFAGAVSPQKGPHVLLDAFAIVARQYPNVRLDFAGPLGNYPLDESFERSDHELLESVAPFYASNMLSRVKARLTGKGKQAKSFQSYLREWVSQELADKVTFLGNVGIRRQLVDRYYDADVFAFAPIWDEGFGIPPVEAMAAGTPVVGSRSGAMVETVKHGETGLLVEKNNAPALAEALLQLLKDSDRREEMGRAARRRALKYFGWETVAAKMLDRYERLCGIRVDEHAGVAEAALS